MARVEVVEKLFAVDVTRPSSTRDSTIGNDGQDGPIRYGITARRNR